MLLSAGVIAVTMLKVAFVLGCLLSLALPHPVCVPFADIGPLFIAHRCSSLTTTQAILWVLNVDDYFFRWRWRPSGLLVLTLTLTLALTPMK